MRACRCDCLCACCVRHTGIRASMRGWSICARVDWVGVNIEKVCECKFMFVCLLALLKSSQRQLRVN